MGSFKKAPKKGYIYNGTLQKMGVVRKDHTMEDLSRGVYI